MGKNAQQTIPRPAQPRPPKCAVPAMVVDFLDQQCGIATAWAGTAVPALRIGPTVGPDSAYAEYDGNRVAI